MLSVVPNKLQQFAPLAPDARNLAPLCKALEIKGAIMATVHLVKDGVTKQGTSLTKSFEIQIEDARSYFGNHSHHYSKGVPRINPEREANHFAEYRHVVLEIFDGEEGGPFESPGYYLLSNLSPRDFLALINQSGPLV
jgi:hypothetical protein